MGLSFLGGYRLLVGFKGKPKGIIAISRSLKTEHSHTWTLGRTLCRKAPAAEISAKKPKKRRPREKTPKRNKHSDMLKPASAKFRRFPAEFRRFPAEFRRFPAACFAQNLILKKTLPGKLKTPPTAKRRLFPKRHFCRFGWSRYTCHGQNSFYGIYGHDSFTR